MSLGDRVRDYAWMTKEFLAAPLRRTKIPRLGEPLDDRPLIVFLPGVYEAGEYMYPLARAYEAAGYQVRSGYLGHRTRGEIGPLARATVATLAEVDVPTVLVAHSKGGLVGRAVLARTDAVAGLIAIATPWRGSILAWPFPRRTALGRLAPGGRDSLTPWGEEREMEIRRRIWSLRPASDPHIPFSGELPGAHNAVIPSSGHFKPLAHPVTIRLALDGAAELIRQA